MEKIMTKLFATLAIGTFAFASPAAANHIFNLETPFPSRGACEAESAELSAGDQDMLLENFPEVFSTKGEVASFLTRAFSCERNASDGQWYITDHRQEVLDSEWFQRR